MGHRLLLCQESGIPHNPPLSNKLELSGLVWRGGAITGLKLGLAQVIGAQYS